MRLQSDEPAVPSAVAYRHRRSWQRGGRKLPGQCTFVRKDGKTTARKSFELPMSGGPEARLDGMSNTCELRIGIVNFEEPKDIDRLWPKGHAAGYPIIMLGHTDRTVAGVDAGAKPSSVSSLEQGKPAILPPWRQAALQGGLSRWRAEDAGESECRPAMGQIGVK